jgi:hypothetical protein
MDTVKSFQISRAPSRITLLGDKTKRPESSQHIIEFPGGAIELSRTTDGYYWAHIIVNRGQPIDDCEGLQAARGIVIDSRIDREGPEIEAIDHPGDIHQIAVLIGKED